MRFTIDRERILGISEDLMAVVPSRIVTTATSGFLIDVDPEGTMRMSATDLTFVMVARSRVIETDGRLRVIVPAQRFVNALRYMTGDTVEIISQGWTRNIQLNDGVSTIRLSVIVEDFPNVETEDKTRVCSVSSSWLRTSITQLEFAAEHNEKLSSALNSMLIDCNCADGHVTVVAGQGAMMCKRTCEVTESYSDEASSFVIPRNAIRVLKTVLKGANACEISGNISGTRLILDTGMYYAAVPLKAVSYPNYSGMFSRKTDCTTTEEVGKNAILSALMRASVVLPNQPNESAPIQLSLHESSIDLSMTSLVGEFNESVASTKTGESIELLFDLKRLTSSIDVMPENDITISCSTRSSPVWISSGDTEIIIMPQVRNAQ